MQYVASHSLLLKIPVKSAEEKKRKMEEIRYSRDFIYLFIFGGSGSRRL